MRSILSNFLLISIILLPAASQLHAAEGDSLWSRTYGGAEDDMAWSLAVTSGGGCLLAGWSDSSPGYWEDAYLVRTNSLGDTLWTRWFGSSNADRAQAALPVSDGFLVAGYTNPGAPWVYDMWLMKVSEQGDSLWSRTYGGPGSEEARALAASSGDGCLLAGNTDSYGAGGADIWVVRVDAAGDSLWSCTFGGPQSEWATAVTPTSDGGYLVAGPTVSYGAGLEDAWVIKLGSGGSEQWSRTYGGPGTDYPSAVIETSDGGCLLAGETYSFGASGMDLWLYKMSAGGDSLWCRTHGGIGDDAARALIETSDGDYLAAGVTNSFGSGQNDMYLVKTDTEGNLLWFKTFGGSANDAAYALQQNDDGDYLLAGSSWSFSGGNRNDMWLVKVEGPSAAVLPTPAEFQPAGFILPPFHPNPFNPETVASYELRAASRVSLRVYDTAGREVATLVDGWRNVGVHEVTFDAAGLPSGIYFAKLQAGDFSGVQKLVLLK